MSEGRMATSVNQTRRFFFLTLCTHATVSVSINDIEVSKFNLI